uniref:Fibronectin type-III domain-containing protein n=2 Tax=Echeneis naucrates TaxID=173247 RepID=A0A665USA9_ECHNA
MEVAALGRPFCVGMLYDCRSDELIPGLTLWDRDDLEKNTRERRQLNSDFEIVASESIQDKTSALNVEASLKASFFGGLVKVGGSAKYLYDNKTSKKQARVTLKYKTTTKFQELSMNHLGRDNMKHPYVFEKGIATHVVTGILYGAQAFFVFDREVSEQEDHQVIQGNLKVMINKIPTVSIGGQGSLNMEDGDRADVQKFSCRFYGDFCLEKNPVTFQDAVEVYQSLPRLLGPNGENTVPIKIWLLPLTVLDSSAAQLVRQISLQLVQDTQNVLEDFRELEVRYEDAMTTTTAQQFPEISKKIRGFKEKCSQFKLEFQQRLSKQLPSIRGGGENEAGLAETIRKIHSSPFNSKDLNEWMDCREREIHTVNMITNRMKNTKIIQTQSQLFQEAINAEHVVCFVFTSLGSDDRFISTLSNYLHQRTEPQHPHDAERGQWFASKRLTEEMRKKAKLFSDFAEENKDSRKTKFVAVGLTDETQKGSSIHLYKDGFSDSENFEPPSEPEAVTASNTNQDSVTLKICAPRFGAQNVTSYSVEYRVLGEDGWTQQTVSTAGEVKVSHLSPQTEYEFRCRAVTSVGVGPANQLSASTLPGIPGRATNPRSLKDSLKQTSERINYDSPSIFKLSLTEDRLSSRRCRRLTLGRESSKGKRIMIVFGATGSGKSDLIDGMINYIVGVEWKDSFRFILTDGGLQRPAAENQNSVLTVYKLNHQEGFRIDYSLTIVDVPEFGEHPDAEGHMKIFQQLHSFLLSEQGVSEVGALYFVAPASLRALTHTQKYTFDFIIPNFEEGMLNNVRVLVTSADTQRPAVLRAITDFNVQCAKTREGLPVHFKFNNSALLAHSTSTKLWDSEMENMKKFFEALRSETKRWIVTEKMIEFAKEKEKYFQMF